MMTDGGGPQARLLRSWFLFHLLYNCRISKKPWRIFQFFMVFFNPVWMAVHFLFFHGVSIAWIRLSGGEYKISWCDLPGNGVEGAILENGVFTEKRIRRKVTVSIANVPAESGLVTPWFRGSRLGEGLHTTRVTYLNHKHQLHRVDVLHLFHTELLFPLLYNFV